MRTLLPLLLLLAQPVLAAPNVVATIPPLTGLVAGLTQDITEPEGLMDASADPHSFSLRPSQLAAIGEADIIFAIGLGLEPWLAPATLAMDSIAPVIRLEEATPNPLFARNFDMSARLKEDPHIWLDPGMVVLWVLEISQTLIREDQAHTAAYRANEFALLREVVAAKEALEAIGARLQAANIQLVVSHDAYQYLERRLGVEAVGMLSDQADTKAGARSLSRIYRTQGPVCLLESEEHPLPEDLLPLSPRIVIDPMGADIESSAGFTARYYGAMITALETCFNQP